MNRILGASLLLVFAGSAYGANVKLKGGKNADVSYQQSSLTVGTRVCLTGLGNEDLFVDIEATGIGEIECENPGGNVAPGQDTEISAGGGLVIPQEEIKNGNVCFTVSTDPVDEDQLDDGAICPNDSWDAHILSVDWTSVELFVYQGDTAQSADLVFYDASAL